MGWQRLGHNWATFTSLAITMIIFPKIYWESSQSSSVRHFICCCYLYMYFWFLILFTSLLYFLDSTYQFYLTVCLSLSDLTSLSLKPSQVHLCCCNWQNFIQFCGWLVCHCIYVPDLYPVVDGYLGCFHILDIVSNSADNIGSACIFFKFVFSFWGMC